MSSPLFTEFDAALTAIYGGIDQLLAAARPGHAGVQAPVPGPAVRRQIVVVNRSTDVKDADLLRALAALQVQVDQHFAPLWSGLAAELVAGTAADIGLPGPLRREAILLLDNADQAGALGYHELSRGGVPVGFCFTRTSEADGSPWTVTLSHELLEQLADPYIQTCVLATFLGRPAVLAYENCDAVEADSYEINGVAVSNFLTPAWFQDAAPAGSRLDYLRRLTQPLSLSPGGYVAYTTDLERWVQYMPRRVRSSKERICPWSRRGRRKVCVGHPELPQSPSEAVGGSRAALSLTALRSLAGLGVSLVEVLNLIKRKGPAALQIIEELLALVGQGQPATPAP